MLHIADYDIQKVLDRLTRTKYMASFLKKPFCMFISPNYLHVVFKLFLSHFIAFMISSLQLIAGPEKFLLVFDDTQSSKCKDGQEPVTQDQLK